MALTMTSVLHCRCPHHLAFASRDFRSTMTSQHGVWTTWESSCRCSWCRTWRVCGGVAAACLRNHLPHLTSSEQKCPYDSKMTSRTAATVAVSCRDVTSVSQCELMSWAMIRLRVTRVSVGLIGWRPIPAAGATEARAREPLGTVLQHPASFRARDATCCRRKQYPSCDWWRIRERSELQRGVGHSHLIYVGVMAFDL